MRILLISVIHLFSSLVYSQISNGYYMKKLFFLFVFFYSTIYFSQNLYTKDNVNLGDKSVFLNSCIDGFDKETFYLTYQNRDAGIFMKKSASSMV